MHCSFFSDTAHHLQCRGVQFPVALNAVPSGVLLVVALDLLNAGFADTEDLVVPAVRAFSAHQMSGLAVRDPLRVGRPLAELELRQNVLGLLRRHPRLVSAAPSSPGCRRSGGTGCTPRTPRW